MDLNNADLGKILPDVIEYVLHLEKEKAKRPVVATATHHPSFSADLTNLPDTGRGFVSTFSLFRSHVAPCLSTSSGPRYLGFITGGVLPSAFVGDVLSTAFDQNVMTSSGAAGSSAADLEAAVLKVWTIGRAA